MNKNTFSMYEGSALTVLFMSDTIILSGGFTSAGIYNCISLLCGTLLSSMLILLTGQMYIKMTSKAVSILTIALALIAIIINLVLFSDFINTCVLPGINPYIIPVLIILVAVYAARNRFLTIIKSTHIVIPVLTIFTAGIILMLIPSVNFTYMKSIATVPSDVTGFIFTTLLNTVVFYVKGLLILGLFNTVDESDTQNSIKSVITGICVYGTAIAIIQLITLAVLGPGLYLQLEYPLYYPPGLTVFGEYFERSEVLTITIFMTSLIYKTAIYLYSIKQSYVDAVR